MLTVNHVNQCAFTNWYPHFHAASIKSIAIEIPEEVITLLLSDKIQYISTDFPQTFVAQVTEAIKSLGGKVFPKLDWSCPKDAKWILGNSLACTCLEDIIIAFKASDFILHDLTQAYDICLDQNDIHRPNQFHLVLKKWCNFFDSMHFRCFVRQNRLIGISQRNCTDFYGFLNEEQTQEDLCNTISDFFTQHFPGSATLDPNYVFDVYVDKQIRVYLLDINVFGQMTDALLFTWDELDNWTTEENIDFRVVGSENSIAPDSYSQYKVPLDLIDHLATPGGFEDFIRQVAKDNAMREDHQSSTHPKPKPSEPSRIAKSNRALSCSSFSYGQ
ncbi:cell division cycle protein [Thraustotheca clavata]|uniref:Cell division cycle protein n=1 Tax=Thraustotheca clavata TaxID=74557 RepID=A0A1V9Y7M9_9STRA|nr:cell division cycle protein [Thraustotheca clavata]